MLTYTILLSALLATAFGVRKSDMLDTNRVMGVEADERNDWKGKTCDECKFVIDEIKNATKSPEKMRELKMILSFLCKETSYEEECRLFVSQIDRFIDVLEPYLKNSTAICHKIHLCANPRIEAFSRISFDFYKRAKNAYTRPQIICDECEFAVKEVKKVIEDKERQVEVRDFLRNRVCASLGSYRGFCDLIVDQYLPEFIEQLEAMLQNEHQVCVDIRACDSAIAKPRRHVKQPANLAEFLKQSTLDTKHGQILMSCFECKLTVDAIQEEMINNRKGIAGDIQAVACNKIVPANMTASCDDFLSLYLPTVVQMTIEQATAAGVCEAMKSCDKKSLESYQKLTFAEIQSNRCNVAKQFELFLSQNLIGSPIEEQAAVSSSNLVCNHVFSFLKPMCESIIYEFIERASRLTSKLAAENAFSQLAQC